MNGVQPAGVWPAASLAYTSPALHVVCPILPNLVDDLAECFSVRRVLAAFMSPASQLPDAPRAEAPRADASRAEARDETSPGHPGERDASELLVRPAVAALAGYVPGEQPQSGGWVKLNTNENPYPPSPKAIEAMHAAIGDRLKVYPDPLGTDFREAAAAAFNREGLLATCDADWVLPGNGSDDCLTILVRSFCEAGGSLALPYPSYILYETLAAIQGAHSRRLLLRPDWSFDLPAAREALADVSLLLLPCPNSPSGTVWELNDVLSLIPPRGVLVVDEAYADFADRPLGPQVLAAVAGTDRERHVVVTRTLSKSYSLAGLRIGYAVAHPAVIEQLRKVKDSYNCDAVALAGGAAALRDQSYAADVIARVRATRERLTTACRQLSLHALDSQANFVWTQHPDGEHERIFAGLKERQILVRLMRYPDAELEGLRLSVGSDDEVDRLLAALADLV